MLLPEQSEAAVSSPAMMARTGTDTMMLIAFRRVEHRRDQARM
jgi:hypothetical protein